MSSQLQSSTSRDLLLWLLRFRRRVRVAGTSMLPHLQPGDEVLFNPRAYHHHSPQVGDLVIAQHPYQPDLRLVKRITDILDNGHYVIKGDNPTESTDSRTFGTVTAKHLLGQVTSRFP
ncbi:MAG: nickel-type superoxide dismutase maturation protease [Chloroflexota bacterium]